MRDPMWFKRAGAAGLGALLLTGVAGAALADETDTDSTSGVDVNVAIEAAEEGALTLSVAASEVALLEEELDAEYRLFTGGLPEVTVTDSRAEVPADAGWYVLGQASDFTLADGEGSIPAGHLGWDPELLNPDDAGNIYEGWRVDTVLDEGPDNQGLQGEELLYNAYDSDEAHQAGGSWRATADLFLKTPEDVAPGQYSSLLTLSLFEDVL